MLTLKHNYNVLMLVKTALLVLAIRKLELIKPFLAGEKMTNNDNLFPFIFFLDRYLQYLVVLYLI